VGALGDAERLGDEDVGRTIDVQLALKLRNFDELKRRVQQISTPGSSEYGHPVPDAEFRARYAPTPGDVSQAEQFLASHGLSVTSANGTLVDARGTVGQVQAAMRTHLSRYRDRVTGRSFFANDVAPALPSGLASRLVGIHGLSLEAVRRHPSAALVEPKVGGGPAGGYTPNEIKTAYNLQRGPLNGLIGAGQTLGLLELDAFRQGSIDQYDRQYYGALKPAPVVVSIDGATNTNPGTGELEVELDIEVVHAVAPSAAIRVYVAPNTDTGINHGYNAMATDNTLNVASTSWGICEQLQNAANPGEANTLNQIFVQAAAKSVSFFAASGDSGAYDCRGPNAVPSDPFYSTLAVDSPASDPFVTAVGGTNLTLGALSSYSSETAWSEPSRTPPRGTGGGLSVVFPQPSWQVGPGVANASSNGNRQVPDVAHVAAPATGYSIYYGCKTGSGVTCSPGWVVVGGTSAGAPAWAAYAALFDQYAASQAKPALGYANPTLYGAARCPLTFAPFHDITTGDNLAYPATTGWDYPTGLGSFKADDLTSAMAGQASASLALQSLQPGSGATTGSTTVTLSGCGFTSGTTVSFGGTSATVTSRLGSPSPP
jgi:kumamolisin